MANYLATDTDLTSVANAIRTKGGASASLAFPAGFVSAIQAIPSGGGGAVEEATATVTPASQSTTLTFDVGDFVLRAPYAAFITSNVDTNDPSTEYINNSVKIQATHTYAVSAGEDYHNTLTYKAGSGRDYWTSRAITITQTGSTLTYRVVSLNFKPGATYKLWLYNLDAAI